MTDSVTVSIWAIALLVVAGSFAGTALAMCFAPLFMSAGKWMYYKVFPSHKKSELVAVATVELEPEQAMTMIRQATGKDYMLHPSGKGIKCLICGNESEIPGDVTNLFCGTCNKFHDRKEA